MLSKFGIDIFDSLETTCETPAFGGGKKKWGAPFGAAESAAFVGDEKKNWDACGAPNDFKNVPVP